MAHKTYKDMIVVVDSAAGATSRITGSVNQASLAGALSLLEDTGLGDANKTYLPGLSGATLTLNGFVNTTTSAIWGPLVGQRTSITKTWGINDGIKWYKGEAWPNSVEVSGSVDSLQTWSAGLTIDGAVTYNSTAPS